MSSIKNSDQNGVSATRGFSTILVPSHEDSYPLGVSSGDVLSATSSPGPWAVVGIRGSDRTGVAHLLHGRLAPGAPLLGVDGGTSEGGKIVVDALERHAETGTTVFIDDVQSLSVEGNEVVGRLLEQGETSFILGSTTPDHPLLEGVEFPLNILPLASRPEDVVPLALSFLSREDRKFRLSEAARELLKSWAWTEDVRELRTVIERIAVVCQSTLVTEEIIAGILSSPGDPSTEVEKSLAEIEEEHILRVLDSQRWNRSRAARVLRIDVKTLYNKLKRYRSAARFQRTATR